MGPRDEKVAIEDPQHTPLAEPGLHAAATVIASRDVPGDPTVPAAGPLFPAETVKTTPFLEARSMARDVGSSGLPLLPRLKLQTSR